MDNTVNFVDKYERREREKILSDQSLTMELDDLKSSIRDADPLTKNKVGTLLKDILSTLKDEEISLSGQLFERTEKLAQMQRSSDACIAYLSSPRTKPIKGGKND
jgi:hypothetical protein